MATENISVKIKNEYNSKFKNLDSEMKRIYESFWLYPESHPYRLAQHITLRGLFAGGTIGFISGFPYAIIKKREILNTVGKFALRGSIGGGVLMGLISAERLMNLPKVGVSDRSYRLSYNWGQTKWDLICLEGSVLSAVLFRRRFNGILPAAAVGVALGTLTCLGGMITDKLM